MAPKPELKQTNRFGVLTTPLGKDANGGDTLALVRFDAREGLSDLFHFSIDAVSLDPDIDFDKAMGRPCTVSIKTVGESPGDAAPVVTPRIFNGILVAAESLGQTKANLFDYRLTLRPWLWLLTRTTNCRIFQDKTVPTIIQKVFEDHGFTDFELKLDDEGSFPELEYCVQYRETDFNFISRLMEKEGIYYFFRHVGGQAGQPGKHILVLANAMSSHLPVPDHKETAFNPIDDHIIGSREIINDWNSTRQMRSGIYEFRDYNYEKPNANMKATKTGSEKYMRSKMELYDYPGNYKNVQIGNRYAQIALEAEQALDHRRYGSGHAISLFAGGLTTLKPVPKNPTAEIRDRLPPDSEFREYLIVHAHHRFGVQDYRTTGDIAPGLTFEGEYEFQPTNRPFRAPIVTPRPHIYGIQTAKVVTKDENGTEEIDVEKLTEIYVHFHWDRNQQKDYKERRSTKLRCAQVWSSKKWGGQFIPRVGMEVVVEFLEGDPDRPIVTGCVYNGDHQPPWELPDKKTISGIKSESTKGDQGCNYWNFEDKKGSEQINVHAEKDLNVIVNNNETRWVGNKMTTTIGEYFKTPMGAASRQTTLKNGDDVLDVDMGQILYTAKVKIELKVGPSKITITPAGITLDAPTITLQATGPITIQGLPVKIN